uniref:Uncharacterized protein n=1 Tax=Anguilla anguilla TaxID=7936 RepID=A0A0E9R345_ANGAN
MMKMRKMLIASCLMAVQRELTKPAAEAFGR